MPIRARFAVRGQAAIRAGSLLLAAGILAAGILSAANRGLADLHYFAARSEFATFERDARAPAIAQLALAQFSLHRAIALEPSNPQFIELLGRVDEMRALRHPPGDPARDAWLKRSLERFRAAVAMRPASPYAWTSIALVKARLGSIDAEFLGALRHAERLGPWEPQVLIGVADAGMASWSMLSPNDRRMIVGVVERATKRQGPEIQRLAQAHGPAEEVCAVLARRSLAPKRCAGA